MAVLCQIRDGYTDRPRSFPHSLALVGLRDVRDYKVVSGGTDRLGTSSPFNIKADSITLRNFTRAEIAALYGSEDDRRFAVDLGLVRRSEAGGLEVANSIYRESFVRTLAGGAADSLPQIPVTWLTPEDRLDKGRLLRSSMDFSPSTASHSFRTAPYHEVAPHLVLMAFLHRVVNGGSMIRTSRTIASSRQIGATCVARDHSTP